MTTKANNLVINLLTAHATWSMTALFKTSQRENVLELEAISPKYYTNLQSQQRYGGRKKIGDRWLRTPGIYRQVPPPGSLRPVESGPLGT